MTANIHLFQTDITHASRVKKHCDALRSSGLFDRVIYIGGSFGVDRQEEFGTGCEAILIGKKDARHASLPAKLLFTVKWSRKVFRKAASFAPSCVSCHSLPLLSLAVKMKKKWGCSLVYEPHELETETIVSRGIRKTISKRLEKSLIGHCDGVIVVSDSIADWYEREYAIRRPTVVRNIAMAHSALLPEGLKAPPSLRQQFNIQNDEFLCLYLGIVGHGRRVDQYLRVFSKLGSPYHLVFMGDGPDVGKVKDLEKRFENIHYANPVPSEHVSFYSATADLGLCGVENACLSYYYSLPNKLFEFFRAGIPCLAPKYIEMSRVIEEHCSGWLHGESDEELERTITALTIKEIKEKAMNAK
ncbi:glycosyltransferase, partial [Verrucomicrobia bacterium]|nr:glycosyltransferase [Verrucomicrobiota bacterium]